MDERSMCLKFFSLNRQRQLQKARLSRKVATEPSPYTCYDAIGKKKSFVVGKRVVGNDQSVKKKGQWAWLKDPLPAWETGKRSLDRPDKDSITHHGDPQEFSQDLHK